MKKDKKLTIREVMKELFADARRNQEGSELFYVDFKNKKLTQKVKDMVSKKKETGLLEELKNIHL